MGWAILAILAGSCSARAKPLDVPVNSNVNGKATPPLTQDFFQVDPLPAPEAFDWFRLPHSPGIAPPVANPAWNRLLVWLMMPV